MMKYEHSTDLRSLRAHVELQKCRIEAAEATYDVKTVIECLKQLSGPITSNGNHRRLFLEFFYDDVVNFLLTKVIKIWENCVSALLWRSTLQAFFDIKYIPAVQILRALLLDITSTRTLSCTSARKSNSCYYSINLLEMILENKGFELIFSEMYSSELQHNVSKIKSEEVFVWLTALPDILSNRYPNNVSNFFHDSNYFDTMSSAFVKCSISHHSKVKYPISNTFRVVTAKLVRIGKAQQLFAYWLLTAADDFSSNLAFSRMMTNLNDSSFESFLIHVFCTSGTNARLELATAKLIACMPTDLLRRNHFQFSLLQKVLLGKRQCCFDLICSLVKMIDERNEGAILLSLLWKSIERWCHEKFLQSTRYCQNLNLAKFIIQLLHSNATQHTNQEEWFLKLSRGIQNHLSYQVEEVREIGMRVAQAASRIISPHSPIDFGIDDEILSSEEATPQTGCHLNNSPQKGPQDYKSTYVDPDMLVVASSDDDGKSSETNCGSDEDSLLDFTTHYTSDEEDNLPLYVYLDDILATFNAESQMSDVKGALRVAESVIRNSPLDLCERAADVAKGLLRLEDKFSIPQFSDMRQRALNAISALAPKEVINVLIEHIFEREQVMANRLIALEAMISASCELAGDSSSRDVQNGSFSLTKATKLFLTVSVNNTFHEFADMFFGSLLNGYLRYKRECGIFELNSLVVANILHALGRFVKNSKKSSRTIKKLMNLIDIAWLERKHPDPLVRRQVLFCFSLLSMVPNVILQAEVRHSKMDMMRWLEVTSCYDPDDICRNLSLALLG